jgi:putative ABC transport system ATP-binding protein
MDVLKVEGVNKKYKAGGDELNALRNVNFSIKKGEFVAIVGPSGSGKSTLLHILGGVDNPDSGTVNIMGVDLFNLSDNKRTIFRRRKIGLIYQFHNLISLLNVEENITLPQLLDGRAVDKKRVDELLELLDLTNKRKTFPNQLSGGQQQRVSIARAIINDPSVMLADEPTGSLDNKMSRDVVALLKYINKKFNQTLIMVTHDESIAIQADRIIQIDDGRIVRDEVISL